MGTRLVPIALVMAAVAFAVASATAAVAGARPAAWGAAVALAVLGGITPAIHAVNIRVVPVFMRRSWPSLPWLRVQVALAIVGAWIVWAARLGRLPVLESVGAAVALAGGLVFTANLVRMRRQPAMGVGGPPADAAQAAVDKVATGFTRLAGMYMVLGLAIGVALPLWRPPVGRWDLVWGHAMLVGFFLSMAVGVCYHVLGRWTGATWQHPERIAWHFRLVAWGLPVMLLALAIGSTPLFAVSGVVEAAAVLLFIVNIAPMLPPLPGPTRQAFYLAAALLAVGVSLGGWFAVDPALGARLRQSHAELNLFGVAGALISGSAYYLGPRFAGQPLRWPRLAWMQIGLLGAGIAVAATGWGLRTAWPGAPWVIVAGQALTMVSFGLLAAVIGGTFWQKRKGVATGALTLQPRPGARPAAAQPGCAAGPSA